MGFVLSCDFSRSEMITLKLISRLCSFNGRSLHLIFHFVLLVTKRASGNACTPVAELDGRQKAGKLTLPDIKNLDAATKSIYLTV